MIPVREDWGKYTSKYPNVQGFSFDFAYEDNYDYNKVRDTVVDIFEKNGCEVEAIQFDTSTFVPGYDDRHDTTVGLDISFDDPYDLDFVLTDLEEGLAALGLKFLGFDTYSISEYYENKRVTESDNSSVYDYNSSFLNNNSLGIKVDKSYKPEDLELWKSIDWKARDYEEYPIPEDNFVGKIYLYGNGNKTENVEFCKYLSSNPIYPPYYGPVDKRVRGYVGPMYDGRTYNGYDIHDRYETQEVYDMLSR